MVTKRDLTEQVWRASNLSWREADRIISEAMDLGRMIDWGHDGHSYARQP